MIPTRRFGATAALLAAGLAAATLLGTSSASATTNETLDQEFATSVNWAANSWFAPYNLPEAVQTFTAGSSQSLTRIELEMFKDGMVLQDDLRIRLFPTDSVGRPIVSGTALATATTSGASLTDSKAWVSFAFTSPVALVSGTRYAIAIYLEGDGSLNENPRWADDSSDNASYVGGQECMDGDPSALFGHQWLCTDQLDFGFRTYMSPTVTAAPQLPNTGSNASLTLTLGSLATSALVAGSFILWRRRATSKAQR